MPQDDHGTPLGEYVRRKAKVQVGDGVDRRGEITVETVTALPHNMDASFADWRLEVDRAVQSLRDELDLPDTDAGDGESGGER